MYLTIPDTDCIIKVRDEKNGEKEVRKPTCIFIERNDALTKMMRKEVRKPTYIFIERDDALKK